jgi:GWxTD domain-containing protein
MISTIILAQAGALWGLSFVAFSILTIWFGASWSYHNKDIYFPVSYLIFSIVILYLFLTVFKYRLEEIKVFSRTKELLLTQNTAIDSMATLAEYRDLRKEQNKKLAVDNFWLKIGNSVERSRELIRIYYNRVTYSNLYFTSNKEGWKTDQGMIFILFGHPSRIRMTGKGETWYYFSRRRGNPIEFRFERSPDGFANQILKWVKTPESQMYWNQAVRSWRNGKVFSPGS